MQKTVSLKRQLRRYARSESETNMIALLEANTNTTKSLIESSLQKVKQILDELEKTKQECSQITGQWNNASD